MTNVPKGRFGNIPVKASYIFLDEESKKRSVKSDPNVNRKPLEIKIAQGYAPDLKHDKFYRNTCLTAEEYHIIAAEKNNDVIAATLDLNALEVPSESTGTQRNVKRKMLVRVACKRYHPGLHADAYFCIKRELQCYRNLSHENIVRFYEVFAEEGDPGIDRAIWLVSERMEHTLEKYYENLDTRGTKEIDIRHMGSLLVQILRGLECLHGLGIMHRNITPKTIGINVHKFEIKILDFGVSREREKNYDHSTNVDTPDYYKPIEILMKVKYNTKVDIWSTAVVASEMLGKKLFEPSGDEEERKMKIRKRGGENAVKDRIFEVLGVPEGKYSSLFERAVPQEISPSRLNEELLPPKMPRTLKEAGPRFNEKDFHRLMAEMLEVNKRMRPSADECLQHPFLKALNAKYHEKSKEKTNDEKESEAAKDELYRELDAGLTRLFFGKVSNEEILELSEEKETNLK